MACANGYDPTEAGVCMTLSAMAYVSSSNEPPIKDALINILEDPQYATKGQWKLVWFGINHDGSNLAYVVRDTTTPGRFAIAIRGTVWNHLDDVVEDMAIFHTKDWTTAVPPTSGLKIARGTYYGLQQLIPLTSSLSNVAMPGVSVAMTLIHFLMIQALDLPAGVATLNSGRGATFTQMDIRISKRFKFGGRTTFEIIGEGFNLTNADNPNTYVANQTSAQFGQPTRFAGDFRQSEQRLFQIGARFEF